MKSHIALVGMLLLIATSGLTGVAARAAEDKAMSKVEISPGYCHMQFPAMEESSLGMKPVLKDPTTTDIIDFYGPCDYDPRGPEEISIQKFDQQLDYEGESR